MNHGKNTLRLSEVVFLRIRQSHQLQQVLLVLDELQGALVRSIYQLSDLLVNDLCCRLTVRLLHDYLALSGEVKRHLSHLLAHPKLHHLQIRVQSDALRHKQHSSAGGNQTGSVFLVTCAYLSVGRLRDLLQVVLSSGGDPSEENLLSHTPSQHHAHPVEQLLFGVQVLFPRQVLSVTQTLPPRDDRHLDTNHVGLTHSFHLHL